MCQLSLHSLQIGCGPNHLLLQSKKQGEKREMSCSLRMKPTSFALAPALRGLTSEHLHRLTPLPALFPSPHARLGLKKVTSQEAPFFPSSPPSPGVIPMMGVWHMPFCAPSSLCVSSGPGGPSPRGHTRDSSEKGIGSQGPGWWPCLQGGAWVPDPAGSLAEGPVEPQTWASASVGGRGCSQHVPQVSGLSSVR